MKKVKSDLEQIEQKVKMHENLLSVYNSLSDAIVIKIEKSSEAYDKLKLAEEKILLQDKIYNTEKAVEMWNSRMEVWKVKFEKDSEQSTLYWDKFLAICNSIKDTNPRINIALAQIPQHDIKDQNTKNNIFFTLRNELIQFIYSTKNPNVSALLRKIDINDMDAVSKKVLEILKQ